MSVCVIAHVPVSVLVICLVDSAIVRLSTVTNGSVTTILLTVTLPVFRYRKRIVDRISYISPPYHHVRIITYEPLFNNGNTWRWGQWCVKYNLDSLDRCVIVFGSNGFGCFDVAAATSSSFPDRSCRSSLVIYTAIICVCLRYRIRAS